MLFALLRGVVMLLAERLKVLSIEEGNAVASVRSDVVSNACCGDPAFGLAHDAERMHLQLPLPQLEPGCRLVPPTILLRFFASAIASHGPQTTKPALRAGVGVRDCGLCLAVAQTLSNVKRSLIPS
jgi:hypothetical protein